MMKNLLDTVRNEIRYLSPELANLFPVASKKVDLVELQSFIGKELPQEFVELYEYCISQGNVEDRYSVFPYSLEFRSLENCLSLVRDNDEASNDDHQFELIGTRLVLEHVDPQIESTVEYSRYRIPIATATRMEICVDLSPSSVGTYGQVIFIDHEYKFGIYLEESLSALFERFKIDLSRKLYGLDEQFPGQLISNDSIDLANWYSCERWAHVPKPKGW